MDSADIAPEILFNYLTDTKKVALIQSFLCVFIVTPENF